MIFKEILTAEIWDISNGSLLGSFELKNKAAVPVYIDAVFLDNSDENDPSFALLTDDWVKIYEGLQQSRIIKPRY